MRASRGGRPDPPRDSTARCLTQLVSRLTDRTEVCFTIQAVATRIMAPKVNERGRLAAVNEMPMAAEAWRQRAKKILCRAGERYPRELEISQAMGMSAEAMIIIHCEISMLIRPGRGGWLTVLPSGPGLIGFGAGGEDR